MGVLLHKRQKKEYLMSLLEEGKRIDGRSFDDYREIEVQAGVIQSAEGSAMARIGTTQILAGIKVEIVEPFANEPETGVLITNGELLPVAHENFESGPPNEDSIEFARVVDRGIRHANLLPFSDFYIGENKVLALFLDLYVLDFDGNLIDTGALAAMAALLDTKMPKIENEQLIRGETSGKLKLTADPVVTTTFNLVGDHILVDGTLDEEIASDSRVSIGTCGKYVVSAQKGKRGTFKKETLLNMINKAFDKNKELVKYLKKI